jgi:murein L,D-transpeptidase YcbB/YkuD
MEQFKFAAGSIIVLALVAGTGYWAVTTMQSGSEHRNTEKIKALTDENESLKEQVEELNDQLAALQDQASQPAEKPVEEPKQEVPKEQPKTPAIKPATTTYKNQTLINELEKLISDNVYMKVGSSGTRVGTVEKFLNLYNKTSNKIDNDYGAGLKAAVAAFQKAEGLTADGEAGPGTFKKMVDWLKKQG